MKKGNLYKKTVSQLKKGTVQSQYLLSVYIVDSLTNILAFKVWRLC